ncbi:sugar transferase [Rhodococcus rhodnii]|uniref:Undecaprenyl-phosphate galactose n=2 Tax=Rhodococcus rhodnii TaxID=38312 RepID=R7WS13_9NOCA|nr:sugar transferase [Rhodococcus rhodnii]EOM78101.1 undecaprenyl-phosphate galactose [Rhodococcus rhodnii LMG 5362]TXG90112.1 sugar transferase [Rhodococcus rhodnii]
MTSHHLSTRPGAGVAAGVPLAHRREWQPAYARRLLITDVVAVVVAVAVAHGVRFGTESGVVSSRGPVEVGYSAVSIGLVLAWLAASAMHRTRSARVVGVGPEEYRRITVASLWLFGAIAIVSLLFRVDFARAYLAVALPLGLILLLLGRWGWRRRIAARRRGGEFRTSVLAVGSERAVRELAATFEAGTADGYRVVAACTHGFTGARGDHITMGDRRVPVLGDESAAAEALEFCGADTVAVTGIERLGRSGLRDLVWALEPFDVDIVVAPGIVDVAGPRLAMRPVAGLPLIHVEKPQYRASQSFQKTAFDLAFAALALLVSAPVMFAAALAIKLTSRGPIFYTAPRIGMDGTPFPMVKFRTMVCDADRRLDDVRGGSDGAGPLFKLRDDPRVTTVGRFLRRHSIDELPQFVNVLRREMSVVGPRPPLPREVESYDGVVRRRLLVKPGVTGLWQVSGRSDLSWEESVRLDLSYVDNWSMIGDLLLVARTIRALVRPDGAY